MTNTKQRAPVLIGLDGALVVCRFSEGGGALKGQGIEVGLPLPKNLRGWRQQNPWPTEVAGRPVCFYAERWGGRTLLLVLDIPDAYLGTTNIINSIDEGIHVVNERGQTIFYNPTMAKMEGMDHQQVIDKDVLALFPSLTPETSTIVKVLRTREPVIDQVQTYHNNKGQRITTINSTIPLWSGAEFIGVLEVAKDVTRLEELALKVVDLQQRLYSRQQRTEESHEMYRFADIVGASPPLLRSLDIARRAAKTSSSVLIYGETGTGKELVAQSIHQLSPRTSKPFIAQNCAALPGSLLEGILFGTVKGSFTGAIDRPGLIEQADGGTLLLDEINSMDIDLQAKLLRVLQEHRVRRLGGLREIPVDIRVIATTNHPPKEALSQGRIRRDLYYRLAVVNIDLPPLSRRMDDIPLLCQHFVAKYNRAFGLAVMGVAPACLKLFHAHSWPGNVRELEHAIEGAMNIIGKGEEFIELHHLPAGLTQLTGEEDRAWSSGLTLPQALEHTEGRMIEQALHQCGDNISRAARLLGISRQSLQYKLRKLQNGFGGK